MFLWAAEGIQGTHRMLQTYFFPEFLGINKFYNVMGEWAHKATWQENTPHKTTPQETTGQETAPQETTLHYGTAKKRVNEIACHYVTEKERASPSPPNSKGNKKRGKAREKARILS